VPSTESVREKSKIVRAISCVEPNTSIVALKDDSAAYFSILDSLLSSISDDVLMAVQTDPPCDRSPAHIQERLYSILVVIAETFRDERNSVFMGKVCTKLTDRGLVSNEKYHMETAQLVFILFGALTMLYSPIPDPDAGKLQMRVNTSSRTIQRRNAATWHVGSQEWDDRDLNTSFDDLLSRFSNHHFGPIPKPRVRHQGLPPESNMLKSQNVSFYTLSKLLNVQISWTTSICEHLEFNLKGRTLKMFRVPSYCYLLCLLEPDKTFLDRYSRLLINI
jgi:hypothetical protein